MASLAKETDRNDRIEGVPLSSEKVRISQTVFDWLFGYDYFIAHRSVDGKDYASALYDALTAKGNELDCFLDVKHYGAGGRLTSMQARALRKTTRLIVIVTPHAHDVDAPYLWGEVAEFQRIHPRGIIVPIGSWETLTDKQYPTSRLLPLLPHLPDEICILESCGQFEERPPSAQTVAKLLNDFSEERRSTKRLRWIRRVVLLLAALLIAAIGLLIYGNQQKNNATRSAREANRQLGNVNWILAEQARDKEADPIRAALLFGVAAAAFESAEQPAFVSNAEFGASLSIEKSHLLFAFPNDGSVNRAVNGAAFSKDESRVLTCSGKTARLWAVGAGGKEPLQSFEHEQPVNGAVFSKDERRVLTWSEDGTTRLWAVGADSKEPLQSLGEPKQSNPVNNVVYANGVHVAFAGVISAAFTKDESRVLTWSTDGKARLWAIGTGGKEPLQIFEHEHPVNGVVLSKDESRLLTWSKDGIARLWTIGPGSKEPLQSFEHKGSVTGAVFSKDESRLLTWSEDGIARLWAVSPGSKEPLQSFEHKGSVTGAVFSKDESRVLMWSRDGSARLWTSPHEPAIPVAERILKLEVLTASTMYGGRELRPLSVDAWRAKKTELDALRAKAKKD